MLIPSEAARSSSRSGVPGTSSPSTIASRSSSSAASAIVRWRIPARSAAIVRMDTFTLLITYQVRERIGRDDGSRARKGRNRRMKFSLYSELQHWPGKSAAQLYEEVLEQIINADRLGYDAYAVIEHFFFPKFGSSPNPFALFGAASQRTREITFRTLVHVLPYHNPAVLASQIAFFDTFAGGRYEFGVGRGHAWIAHKAGVPVEETRDRYQENLSILLDALDNERFSHDGRWFKVED